MRTTVLAAAGVLSLACANGALAQTSPPRTISIGQTVTGELLAKEEDKDKEWIADYFDLRGTKGETVTITLNSDDFDPSIDLDKDDDHLAEDDDGGEILDSRLVFEFPDTGVYRINVTSSERDETGKYTLRVVRGGVVTAKDDEEEDDRPARPARQRDRPSAQTIRYGQTIQGRLTDTSPMHRDDTPYLPYVFNGKKGEVITAEMTAEFDAYLVLQLPNDNEDLATNDDGAGGTNAKLVYTLPVDGQYEIRANAISEDATGPFTLKLGQPQTAAQLAQQTRASATTIRMGQATRGKLESGDAKADDGTYYDLYRFTAKARQTVVIQLSSSDFDSYLTLSDGNDEELESNDDAKDGETDAEIVYTIPRDGDYYVKANTVSEDETGDYLLGLSVR